MVKIQTDTRREYKMEKKKIDRRKRITNANWKRDYKDEL